MGWLEVEGRCRVLGGVVAAVATTLFGHHNPPFQKMIEDLAVEREMVRGSQKLNCDLKRAVVDKSTASLAMSANS